MKLFELVTKGKPEFIHGFIQGFAAGSDHDDRIYRCEDYEIDDGHLRQHFSDWLGLKTGKYSAFVLSESLLEPVLRALEQVREQLDFTISAVHEVRGLQFQFEANIYSEKIAENFKRSMSSRDSNITLHDYEPEEVVHKDAEGAEMYAPEHVYELHANASASGPFSPVLSLFYRLKEIPQVKVEKMELLIEE